MAKVECSPELEIEGVKIRQDSPSTSLRRFPSGACEAIETKAILTWIFLTGKSPRTKQKQQTPRRGSPKGIGYQETREQHGEEPSGRRAPLTYSTQTDPPQKCADLNK